MYRYLSSNLTNFIEKSCMKTKILTISYFLAGALCILAGYTAYAAAELVTKALLMPLLMLILLLNINPGRNSINILFFVAIAFAWAGDILLEFTGRSELFFILGLASFLLAHAAYLAVFIMEPGKNFLSGKRILILVPVLVYGICLLAFLSGDLGTLKGPVIIYAVTILAMLAAAINRAGKVTRRSYLFVLSGAVLFVLSDSILAIARFSVHFSLSGASVMITYILAQYFIVAGYIWQYREDHRLA